MSSITIQAPLRCTKCNINGQCTDHRIVVPWSGSSITITIITTYLLTIHYFHNFHIIFLLKAKVRRLKHQKLRNNETEPSSELFYTKHTSSSSSSSASSCGVLVASELVLTFDAATDTSAGFPTTEPGLPGLRDPVTIAETRRRAR